MNPQEILVSSLDFQRILRRTTPDLSIETIRAMNGLTDYLCTVAAIDKTDRDFDDLPDPGTPFHSELIEQSKHEESRGTDDNK